MPVNTVPSSSASFAVSRIGLLFLLACRRGHMPGSVDQIVRCTRAAARPPKVGEQAGPIRLVRLWVSDVEANPCRTANSEGSCPGEQEPSIFCAASQPGTSLL